MTFHKIKFIFFGFKETVSLLKNDKFDRTNVLAMLQENKIGGYLHYNKSELADVLVKRGLLPETIKVTTITSLSEREIPRKK